MDPGAVARAVSGVVAADGAGPDREGCGARVSPGRGGEWPARLHRDDQTLATALRGILIPEGAGEAHAGAAVRPEPEIPRRLCIRRERQQRLLSAGAARPLEAGVREGLRPGSGTREEGSVAPRRPSSRFPLPAHKCADPSRCSLSTRLSMPSK